MQQLFHFPKQALCQGPKDIGSSSLSIFSLLPSPTLVSKPVSCLVNMEKLWILFLGLCFHKTRYMYILSPARLWLFRSVFTQHPVFFTKGIPRSQGTLVITNQLALIFFFSLRHFHMGVGLMTHKGTIAKTEDYV